jgi:peroxin-7
MMFKSDQSACSVHFSPFVPGKLAVATSQNFGVVGNGRLVVLQPSQQGLQRVATYDTVDGALLSSRSWQPTLVSLRICCTSRI